jgi:hypothetical protein
MLPKVSFFDQAAEKLREAMGTSASGLERMRLMDEALALYHLHQDQVSRESAGARPVLEADAAPGG